MGIQTLPYLQANSQAEVVLDFENVHSVTQSFIHALLKEIITVQGDEVLDFLVFRNCNEYVQTIISIVVDYVQDSLQEDEGV